MKIESLSIDELESCIETDRLVAGALGWVCVSGEDVIRLGFVSDSVSPEFRHLQGVWHLNGKRMACDQCGDMRKFSTDLNDAFWAAEQSELFWRCLLTKDVNGKDPFIIYKWDDAHLDNLYFVDAETPAMAICKAILELKNGK